MVWHGLAKFGQAVTGSATPQLIMMTAACC
jgi:hypothetical protein